MAETHTPEKLPIEFRGRNGWARFESAYVRGMIGNGDPIAIEMYSRRVGEFPPLVISGEREDVRALLQRLIDQIDAQVPREIPKKAEAYRVAHAAGWDVGNRSMRAAGRTVWNADDYNAAAEAVNRFLGTEGAQS